VIGFAGRLLHDKGIHVLVTAHQLLRAKGRDYTLAIAGVPDPANPSCVTPRLLEDWRRLDGVTLLGHVDKVDRFWPRVHVAVLPSRREGLPKSLLEAAACGRPMVAADVPGCREVVIPDRTGLLVPPDDPEALADAIDALGRSRDLRARYGREARKLAETRFGAQLIAEQTASLYASLLSRHSSRRPGQHVV
jgi:glycosyltransferase involved in cell wall biosynthesis